MRCKRLFKRGYELESSVSMGEAAGRDSVLSSLARQSFPEDTVLQQAVASNDIKTFTTIMTDNLKWLKRVDDQGWTPLHHAASNNSTDVLTVLLQHKLDLNAVSDQGETALHLAVKAGNCEVIELLVHHGADGSIQNHQSLTPVHLAVQLKKYDCLRSLLKEDKIDSQVRGEYGMTPFHLASGMDDPIAARILLDHNAYMCKRCDLGLSALHYAAKNASKQVLNLIIELAEAKGYTRDFLLSSEDKYKHSPLHLAINSGNIQPVQVCLEAGARIDSKQQDGSTAVHLVCSQPGALETVKLMNKLQPKKFQECLQWEDANGMIPLHRAALFDFHELAEYLIQQGSPLNKVDCNGRTPLLLAASRQCWATLMLLAVHGADVTAKDHEQSNFLHLAIQTGGDMTEIWQRTSKCALNLKLMNEVDIHGRTPLHYASKSGNIPSIVGLLEEGAIITVKDNSKQSPLHFASRYGRVNTCRALLDTPHGGYIINDTNYEGKTPLHLASEFGHVKIVALLMQRGALLHRDYEGNSPLHLAVKHGFTQTIKLLINVHPSLLNTENNEGNTPLHEAAIANKPKAIDLLLTLKGEVLENKETRTFLDIAIERSHPEAALAVINHHRWSEILKMPTVVLGTYILGLVRYLPDTCNAALDRCCERSAHDPISPDYNITYRFGLIRMKTDKSVLERSVQREEPQEESDDIHLSPLMCMVKYQRVQCLSHPVCLRFVDMKWEKVGFWFHLMILMLYGAFLGCLTTIVIVVGPKPVSYLTANSTVEAVAAYNTTVDDYEIRWKAFFPMMLGLLIFVGLSIMKMFAQIIQTKWRYFASLNNYVDWILYAFVIAYLAPQMFGMNEDWMYNCGTAALFFAWINLLLVLQSFEFFGTYVVMFREILATLLQVLVVFSILLFAFGVTFYALLRNEVDLAYTTIPLSVFSSIVMMVGDMNYMDTFVRPGFDGDPMTSHFSAMAFFILSLFLLFVPILLMNLLIGLAVGDIEGVQKNARLKRLATQVELTADMEKKMPNWIIRKVVRDSVTEYPNHACASVKKWYRDLVRGDDRKGGGGDNEESAMYLQVMQQKARLKTLQAEMKSQTDLLNLIVAKMEIKTESTTMDEGCQDEDMDIAIILKQAASKPKWKSKAIEDTVKRAGVVSRWSKEAELIPAGQSSGMTPVDEDKAETNL